MTKDALSRERIVDAAIAILDAEGEDGLTFRALAARLETGAGAIYWHVENKSELLFAASNALVTRAMAELPKTKTPRAALRTIAVAVYRTLDAHPWIGAQLSRAPWEVAMLSIFEHLGQQLVVLGIPMEKRFAAASALLGYVVGVSTQNAANGRLLERGMDRTRHLAREAERWQGLDATAYPFTRSLGPALREHDDEDVFVAGLDLIIAGIIG